MAVAQFCVTKSEKPPTCYGSAKRLSRSLAAASERHFKFLGDPAVFGAKSRAEKKIVKFPKKVLDESRDL